MVGQSGDFEADYYRYRPVISPDGRWLAAGTRVGISIVDTLHGCEIKSLRTGQPTVPVGIDDRGQLRVMVSGQLLLLPTDWNADTNELVMGAFERFASGLSGRWRPKSRRTQSWQSPGEKTFSSSTPLPTPARSKLRQDRMIFALVPSVPTGNSWPAAATGWREAAWRTSASGTVKPANLCSRCPGASCVAVRFSPRGKWLATRSTIDNVCQLWHVGSWEAVRVSLRLRCRHFLRTTLYLPSAVSSVRCN